VILLLGGCSSRNLEKELLGAWIPVRSPLPMFILFKDSAWVLERETVETYTYEVEEGELKFYRNDKQHESKGEADRSFMILR
jgi:hypothetical protein